MAEGPLESPLKGVSQLTLLGLKQLAERGLRIDESSSSVRSELQSERKQRRCREIAPVLTAMM